MHDGWKINTYWSSSVRSSMIASSLLAQTHWSTDGPRWWIEGSKRGKSFSGFLPPSSALLHRSVEISSTRMGCWLKKMYSSRRHTETPANRMFTPRIEVAHDHKQDKSGVTRWTCQGEGWGFEAQSPLARRPSSSSPLLSSETQHARLDGCKAI